MTQVVSFENYTPPARFDSIPWANVKIEESDTTDVLRSHGLDDNRHDRALTARRRPCDTSDTQLHYVERERHPEPLVSADLRRRCRRREPS
jgi:hypothetical protein